MRKILLLFLIVSLFLIVGCNQNNDLSKVEKAMNEITISSEITSDINLPLVSSNNVSITWSSSNKDYITNDGKVTRPSSEVKDVEVILTAKFVLNDLEKAKQFKVIVKALEEDQKGDTQIDEKIDYQSFYKYVYEGETVDFIKGYKNAGLYNKDGSLHEMPSMPERKNEINVIHYGAIANDPTFDNTGAFKSAIAACGENEIVYIPNGEYYFTGHVSAAPYYAHIQLKSSMSFIGESTDGVRLISKFTENECLNTSNTATIMVNNCKDVLIKNITCTAIVDDINLPDPSWLTRNNPNGNKSAPEFGIAVVGSSGECSNIVVSECTVEYFQYSGIRLHCTIDCQVINCNIRKATDIGGGGAGYGIEIRGYGHEKYEYIDTSMDSRYNIVSGCIVTGPYIRHGIILSYMTHNNLFYKNTVNQSQDDAFDVHGQDEFLNMFAYNLAKNGGKAAGFALGNTGSTHDKSGVGNVFWRNTTENNPRGFTVSRGTLYTVIVENTIRSCKTQLNTDNTDNNTTIWKDNN